MRIILQYDTSNLEELAKVTETLSTEVDRVVNYYLAQYNLSSLVHFCQTGKFLDEV